MTKLNLNDEKLKAWMDSYVKKNRFNGCSLSIADIEGNTLLDLASGHADKDKTKEFNSQSIVRIFSMTKAIVSTCLLQLTHDKKINLEDTLDHYFDNYSDCFALIENAKNVSEIEKTIKEDVPVSVSKGNFIAEGFSKELDELRGLLKHGKSMLDKILKKELLKNDIPSLKIGFNNIFGYYFEVRNTHKEKVPNEWIRKQTLVNAERYINEDLKNYETKILGAEEKIQELELSYYSQLLNSLQENLDGIMVNSTLIGEIDCFLSFAIAASKFNFCKPVFNESNNIQIIQGRHPVIEQNLKDGEIFIPNNIELDQENQQIMMISGPNMSGKSAILRQTALIIIMAQIGSYVPAKEVNIGITDKIFTRVGASDNISQGESTFMVEMNEAAAILNNLTSKSLILLDEIGRGTCLLYTSPSPRD